MGAASSNVRCEARALSAFGFTLKAYSRGASTKLLRTRGDDSSSCHPSDEWQREYTRGPTVLGEAFACSAAWLTAKKAENSGAVLMGRWRASSDVLCTVRGRWAGTCRTPVAWGCALGPGAHGRDGALAHTPVNVGHGGAERTLRRVELEPLRWICNNQSACQCIATHAHLGHGESALSRLGLECRNRHTRLNGARRNVRARRCVQM
jgi:hypothetical protein